MQETPLFTIRYYNTEELLFDFTKLLPVYKKRLKLYRVLSFCICIPVLAIFANHFMDWGDVDWGMQIFMLSFALYLLMFPLRVKMRVRNRFKKDPTNKEAVLMMIYEERLEVANSLYNSSLRYEGIDHVEETPIGVFLFLNAEKAISIPREAVSEQALEFLKKKIG